jgi:UDP-GlcNAc:undecaprenyl-phosphate/decaprenyl-phosphate GlcNAc-1-phosphate transferase
VSSLPLWAYAVVLATSLLLSLVLTPLALALALHLDIFDHPGPAKAHRQAVPYLGGAAIVVSFAAVTFAATVLRPPPSGVLQLAGFLVLGVLLAIVGLVDDIRGGLSPWLRLGLELGAGLAVWSMGYAAHLPGIPRALDAVVTVLWVAGITNAFNLLDNMDGLSAGVTSIAALSIFGIALLQHRYLVAALAVALAGCAGGFLRHNFHPARIYMGDAGSLFLGFMIAVLLLKLRASAPTRVGVAVILAVPGVALFDTTLVMVSRVAHKRNPFNGGQDHTSHRFVYLGLSVRKAVAVTYLVGAALGGVAIAMTQVPSARIFGVAALLAVAALAAVPLFRVPVYKVPWAQAKGRKFPSLPNEETGARDADNGGPDNDGPAAEAIQFPEPAPPAPAKT